MDEVLHTTGDAALAALAETQSGVVSYEQLVATGLGRGAIHHRVLRRRLHRLHRGVYAVGHRRLTADGHVWAAVLAFGGPDVAVLSHRSAAASWELLPSPSRVDVTTLRASHSTAATRVHRGRLAEHEIVWRDGLRVTTVARTLIDLATVLTPHQLERVCHRSAFLRILDTTGIDTPPRALRAALSTLEHGEPQMTRSELEERFLSLIAQLDLPTPLVNGRIQGHEVDFHWPRHRLIVEVDGAAAHLTSTAFEEDRRRDAELQVAGWRVVRFTWRQLTHGTEAVAGTLKALLS
jgi:hypothetical protein